MKPMTGMLVVGLSVLAVACGPVGGPDGGTGTLVGGDSPWVGSFEYTASRGSSGYGSAIFSFLATSNGLRFSFDQQQGSGCPASSAVTLSANNTIGTSSYQCTHDERQRQQDGGTFGDVYIYDYQWDFNLKSDELVFTAATQVHFSDGGAASSNRNGSLSGSAFRVKAPDAGM